MEQMDQLIRRTQQIIQIVRLEQVLNKILTVGATGGRPEMKWSRYRINIIRQVYTTRT
jgi:hypothetical protein